MTADASSHQADGPAFHIHGADRAGRWLVTCDHATNRVPVQVAGGDLGLPAAEMGRHIAHDIGALGLAVGLAARLDSPAIASDFSRLVIDPNRGEDDPTLIMQLYDGTIIPANRHLDAEARAWRLNALYRPYHAALAGLAAARPDRAILSVHSFTPCLRGRAPRPWHVGVLSAADRRLSDPLIDLLRAEGDLCVGDNEPYAGHLPGDAMNRHALAHGRLNTLIEVRQDLIATPEAQDRWAARLAPLLARALALASA